METHILENFKNFEDFNFYCLEKEKTLKSEYREHKKFIESALVLLVIKYLTNYFNIMIDNESSLIELEDKVQNIVLYLEFLEEHKEI